MQYFLIPNSDYIKAVKDDGSTYFIPNNSANKDWQQYQAWLAEDPENNIPQEEEGE